MNKKITWVVTFLLFVALIVSAFTVMANILPHERYGQAFIEGSDADDGLTVTSWIDGTQYADNLTFYGDGSFQIQTPGDSTDDASIKEGGVDGDTIVYRIEDADGTYIADENSVFDSGAIESGDLNFQTAEQPSTDVKINEIVTQPEFGDSQYVYLYDTDGITLGDWRLENHDGFSATLDTLDTGTHPDHAELLYVDLGATDVIDTTGDSMMLSWNPGTSGINNNEWAVMDRVEFGDITSPENTTHPEYPDAPGVGQGLVRDTWGSDTDDSSVDFTLAEETGRPVNLTIDSTEGGSVTTPGEGTFDYVTGDVVDLVAEADADYSFVEWTGDNGTIDDVNAASTTITMEGNYSITANFEMDVAPGPVYNLHVEKDEAAGDLILSWDEEPNADQYNVYHSTDAYADFGTWTELDTVTGLEYTHSGALGGDNYYIVRAENTAGEGANSSMAFCYEAFFDSTEGGLHYTSVPNNFDYNGDGELTSFDVIESITGGIDQQGNLDQIVKWDPSSIGYTETSSWSGMQGQWVDEFDIQPGDGIGLEINGDVTWYVNATDAPHPTAQWNDTFYDSTEGGLHYTTVDIGLMDHDETGEGKTSFDIIMQITGGLDQQGNLDQIVKWDPSSIGYTETSSWSGMQGQWVDEFDIQPGDGIGLEINGDVEWTRVLETEPVNN